MRYPIVGMRCIMLQRWRLLFDHLEMDISPVLRYDAFSDHRYCDVIALWLQIGVHLRILRELRCE